VRGTHDAETGSEKIEKNGVVNGVKCSTDVEREKSGKCNISCMVDSIKMVNERDFIVIVSSYHMWRYLVIMLSLQCTCAVGTLN